MTRPVPERFRPSAKAVVVHDGKVLLTRNRTPGDHRPDWHIFPGGGQHPGETLDQTLVREVREETGIEIEPGRLLWVRELIAALRPEFPFDPADHAIEFMFEAHFVADHGDAHEEDQYQQEVVWVDPAELDVLRFYPAAVVPALLDHLGGGSVAPMYFGDVD
jgi:8-oxo-dGTP pyrophosphatase MutT (NUDIX family)